MYYNKEFALFEEFVEKLADDHDVGKGEPESAYQLRKLTYFKGTIYNVTNNQSRIGYYVMVLDKIQGFAFVKTFRLPIFLKSELYAEYKLTLILSTLQVSAFYKSSWHMMRALLYCAVEVRMTNDWALFSICMCAPAGASGRNIIRYQAC